MGLPVIDIIFKQKAAEAVKRSALGIVGLVVKEPSQDWTMKEYKLITDVDEKDYTDSVELVKDTFKYTPNKVLVFNLGDGNLGEVLKAVAEVRVNWLGLAYDSAEDTATLVDWIKAVRKQGKTYKAITWKAINPEEIGVVNFANESVTFADKRGERKGWEYIPTLLGILAGLPMTRSSTKFLCGNLVEVSRFEDLNKEIDGGKFCLFKEEGKVRIARGCTSLTETTQDLTPDMKDIIIIESMDLIRDDIYTTFNKYWSGKWKNKYDNQVLLMTTINAYFQALANEDILDPEYKNKAMIDIEAIKLAWLSVGKDEVEEMTDEELKKLSFKKTVFLLGDIKILNAIEDFKFTINMF